MRLAMLSGDGPVVPGVDKKKVMLASRRCCAQSRSWAFSAALALAAAGLILGSNKSKTTQPNQQREYGHNDTNGLIRRHGCYPLTSSVIGVIIASRKRPVPYRADASTRWSLAVGATGILVQSAATRTLLSAKDAYVGPAVETESDDSLLEPSSP